MRYTLGKLLGDRRHGAEGAEQGFLRAGKTMTINFRHQGKSGFTLIELLVVISIIALLISILLPSLAKAKEDAEATVCESNIRQLLISLQGYVNTNSGMFPLDGILFPHVAKYPPYVGSASSDPQVYELYQTWSNTQSYNLRFGALFPYMANLNDKAMDQATYDAQHNLPSYSSQFPSLNPAIDRIAATFMCPADSGFRDSPNAVTLQNNWSTVQIGPEPSGGFWSYSVNSITNSQAAVLQTIFGVNQQGSPETPWSYPLTSGAINNPKFLIFIEESAQHSNFNDEVMDPVGYNTGDALSERHNGGGNLGFWDGHVQWMSASEYDNVPNAQGDTLSEAGAISPIIHWFFPTN